jgi:peptidoglycan/xylan/chitin deacetylase (PgdA/CDA1 family)
MTRRVVAALAMLVIAGCSSSTASPPVSSTASSLPGSLRGHVVSVIPTARHVVALTFDAGSGNQGLGPIRRTLAANGVRATFFVTGDFARNHPRQVTRVATDGHVVGNHTQTHPHSTTLGDDALRQELSKGAASVEAATGTATRPWFRFPFGEYDGRTLRIVNDMGYAAIGWTVDTLGWQGRKAGGPKAIVRRVLNALRPGEIVLMHVGANPNDGSTLDADALPRVISRIRAAGYSFTTVRLLLRTS